MLSFTFGFQPETSKVHDLEQGVHDVSTYIYLSYDLLIVSTGQVQFNHVNLQCRYHVDINFPLDMS